MSIDLYNSLKSQIRTDQHPWFFDTFMIYVESTVFKSVTVNTYLVLSKFKLFQCFINMTFGLLSTMRYDVCGRSPNLISMVNGSEVDDLNSFLNFNLINDYCTLEKKVKYIFTVSNIKFLFISILYSFKIYRIWKMIRNENILVQLRTSELIFLYLKLNLLLRERKLEKIILGTISSPYALALSAYANKNAVNNYLFDHGYYINDHTKLKFTGVVFNSKFSHDLFKSVGNRFQKYVIRPNKVEKLKFNDNKSMLILLPKIYDKKFVENLESKKELLIRYHPQNLLSSKKNTNTLDADLNSSYLCFSGSSSVLIECLIKGKPCLYLEGIDIKKQEGYEFVKSGFVLAVNSLNEVNQAVVESFYLNDLWRKKFEENFKNDITLEQYQDRLALFFS